MVSRGFAKHLRRNPLSDHELTEALTFGQMLINSILHGDGPVVIDAETVDLGTEPVLMPFRPVEDEQVGESVSEVNA